ncbi:hypothetical protein BOX15_Mlig004131g1, partial [Macrostomum lignano]
SKAFPPQTPKPDIYNLIFDANTECQLTHHVIRGLTSNNLYSAACSTLFPNSRQETWTDHDCILRNLRRRGIPVLDEKGCQITQTVLQRDEGGNLHKAHLALIDGLMIAYIEECASSQEIEAAVGRFCTRTPPPQVPKATPEALDLWIREANAAALKALPVPPDRLLDASARLALLINFYAPDLLPVTTVDLNGNLSWQRKVDNWSRVRDFCASYLADNPFVAHPADIVRSADQLKLNLTCLTAELFRHLEISGKFKPSYQIYRTYPAMQQQQQTPTPTPRRQSASSINNFDYPSQQHQQQQAANYANELHNQNNVVEEEEDEEEEEDFATPESEEAPPFVAQQQQVMPGEAQEDDDEEEATSLASEARSDDSKTTWLDYARKTAQKNTAGDLAARGVARQQPNSQQQQQQQSQQPVSNLDLKIRLEMKKRQIELEKKKLASQSKRDREEKGREIFMQLVQRQAASSTASGTSAGAVATSASGSGGGSGPSSGPGSVKEVDAAYSDRLDMLNNSLTSLQDEIKKLSLQQERAARASLQALPEQQPPKQQQPQQPPQRARATWRQQPHPQQPQHLPSLHHHQQQHRQRQYHHLPFPALSTSADEDSSGGGFRLSPVADAGPSLHIGSSAPSSSNKKPKQQQQQQPQQSSHSSDLTVVSLANSHGTVVLDRPSEHVASSTQNQSGQQKQQFKQEEALEQQQQQQGFFLAGEEPAEKEDLHNVQINKNNFFISFDDDGAGATAAAAPSPRRAKRKPQLSSSLRSSATKNGATTAGANPNSSAGSGSVDASVSSTSSDKKEKDAAVPVATADSSENEKTRKSPVLQNTAFIVIDDDKEAERAARIRELQQKTAARQAELAQKRAERERLEEEKAARKAAEREEAERKKAEERQRREEIFRLYKERKQQDGGDDDAPSGATGGGGGGGGGGYGGSRSVSAKSTIRRPKSMFIAAAAGGGAANREVKKSPSVADLNESAASEAAASSAGAASAAAAASSTSTSVQRSGSVAHLTAQDPNLRLFVKPKSKTNKHVINNAISHCCLAGIVNEPVKKKALADLDNSEMAHFVILFRDAKCQYRGLYGFIPESEVLVRLSGRGPRDIDHSMVDCFFKYNSGSKKFSEIKSTKHLSPAIDAVSIQDRFWKNQGRSASTTRK